MSESTLSISFGEIQRFVGRYLGFNRTPASWSSNQTTDVADITDSGLRSFYGPPILPGERTAWKWSFLHAIWTLGPLTSPAIVEGTADYALPDLFGGFLDRITYAAGDGVPGTRLRETSYTEILQRREDDAVDAYEGRPVLFAVYPLSTSQTASASAGERFKIALWPAPSTTFTFSGEYYLDPFSITAADNYPLGGEQHAETILAACLASAEMHLNQTRGVQYANFIDRLRTSVAYDRSIGPKYWGYNADRSSNRGGRFTRHGDSNLIVLYNGNDYSA